MATIALDPDFNIVWQTPGARRLARNFSGILMWVKTQAQKIRNGLDSQPLILERDNGRHRIHTLYFSTIDNLWLMRVQEQEDPVVLIKQKFAVTNREAEVLYWMSLGKTNREIAQILGTSHRTVHKQLEVIFQKLNVETRTAAAHVIRNKIPEL